MERCLLSELLHGRDQTNVRAADRPLSGRHFDSALRGGAAAVLLRAIVACALATRNTDLFGNGLIAWNLFFDGFRHAAFAAGMDLFVNGLVAAEFHLLGFRVVSGSARRRTEH